MGSFELSEALVRGTLGQGNRSAKERCLQLISLRFEGAISIIMGDRINNHSDWGSEKEQYEILVSLAEKGWTHAQEEVCNANKFNIVGGTPTRTEGTVMELIMSGKSRHSAPSYIMKYKNGAYFKLLSMLLSGTPVGQDRFFFR